MKRYLIPILIILGLASGVVVGCGEKRSSTELQSYVEQASPIMERHTETTEETNQANRALLETLGSGSQEEILKALTTYKNMLAWALTRVDSELLDFKKLVPPPEVRPFHSLMVEGLTKEQAGLTKQLSYYSSVLRYGFGDDKELDDGNALLLDAQELWLQAQYELQDLIRKVK